MKIKKIIAMICAISVIASIIALPASAQATMFVKKIVDDSFDSSLGNWKLGHVANSTTGYSLGLDTFDGATVMKFTDVNGYGNPGSLPNIANFLDNPLMFTENSKVIVKTRFYHTGNTSGDGIVNLKINRPDNGTLYANNNNGTQENETGMEWYNLFRSDASSFQYKKTATNTNTKLSTTGSMGKWVEVEIEFDGTADGNPEDILITAKYTGAAANGGDVVQEYGTIKQHFNTIYTTAGYNGGVFDSIKNFTWLIRAYANTLYVDYFQIIEERPYITVSSAAVEKNKITTSDDIRLTFTADADIESIPSDAVYIEGVEADFSYDATSKTVTLSPKADLTPGAELIVKVDKNKLYSQDGIIYNLSTEFTVNVSDVRLTSVNISGHSIEGEAVGVISYGYESTKPESLPHEYQWQMSATGEEGTFTDIDGATSDILAVTAAEADKYLRVKMTPYADNNGEREQGSPAFSNIIMPEFAPEISNIRFNMETPYTNTELSLNYTFTDKNGEAEDVDATIIEWYTASDVNAVFWDKVYTGRTYTPVDGDFGKYIRCIITPYSDSEFKPDGERTPTEILGPVIHPPFVKYHIDDDFTTGLGNWKLGVSNYEADNNTLTNVTEGDFAGTLKFVTKGSSDGSPNTPRIITELDKPVELKSGSKVIVKTRFYNTGDGTGAGIANLKINRPDVSEIIDSASGANDLGMQMYTLFRTNNNNIEYGYGSNVTKKLVSNMDTLDVYNKWIEAELVFDGSDDADPESYTLKIKIGDTEYPEVSTTIKQTYAGAYTAAGYTNVFDTLKTFTWMLRTKKNTLYIDYFKVIEERPYVNATATLDSNYIATASPVKVVFTSELEIPEIPEDAVYIEGVDTEFSYDKATKTVTLTPSAELAPDTAYAVKIDASKLEESVGVKYSGAEALGFDTAAVSVNSLTAVGRNIPGTVIEGKYQYASNYDEGTHQYQWQMSENGTDGWQDIDGATSKDLSVTDNVYGKYLRFKMIPYGLDEEGNNTYYGFETYSNVIIPEKAPYIKDGVVELSSSVLFVDSYVSAVYTYADDNGDIESGTDIRWYTADSISGAPTEVGTGKAYYITEADIGKYIKCSVTPKNSALEGTGATYECSFEGPVSDIMESTNLYINPGFETGDMEGYTSGIPGTEVTSKDAHTGEYSFHLTPRTGTTQSWGQKLPVTADNVYISACYAKKSSPDMQDILGFWPYSWASYTERADGAGQFAYILNDKWQLVVGSFKATASGESTVAPVSFEDMDGCDAYVDDMYFGELMITDIETYELEAVTVPQSGSVSVPVTSGKVLNQVGTQHGLWNEKVEVIIPETQGVSVNGNNIIVDNTATSGKIDVEIRCVPSYVGAEQSVFQKFAELEISAHNDKTPKALNVEADGTLAVGATVSGSYDFYQVDGEADNSTVRWMYSDTEDGEYYDIPGANSSDYVVEAEYVEKYLRFVVSPKSESGLVGEDVRSGIVTKARVPVASDVSVRGSFNVGDTLTATYSYYDPNKDAEGATIFRWYAADSANGTYNAIAGATSETLTLTDDLVGKYIKLGVTPVSSIAPHTGAEVLSDAYAGPAAPVALNVSISQDETRLVGNYDFYHIHGTREADSVYKWTIDGKVVSNAIDYVINFTGVKTVTFTVTPVAESNPARGASVSVSATVTGNSGVVGGNTPVGGVVIGGGTGGFGGSGGGGGGGSSSGGSGGGSFTSGVTSVNDMQLGTPQEEKPVVTSDLDGHWGKEYIEEMVTRGVMSADASGKYNPDELVERQDMLTYLFKTLGLEATDYEGIFEDVEDSEFGGMLQTMVDNGTIAVDTHFRPEDNISREEMCKILYISLDNAGKLEKIDEMVIEAFEDYNDISEWAKEYVNGICANKIMIGVSDTRFAAKENLTKAQAATLLTRIIKLIEGEE